MDPKISKELKKATENLQTKMLALQDAEAKQLKLKTAFVNTSKDPADAEAVAQRGKLKIALIKMHKEVEALRKAAEQADAEFHRLLATEPEEDQDLLDHKLYESRIRLHIRKAIKELLHKNK